jgi:hypothetical protein
MMAKTWTMTPLRELSDDELADLGHAVDLEQARRVQLRQGPSWVEDIRQSLQGPSICSCGYALGHPGPCQALF